MNFPNRHTSCVHLSLCMSTLILGILLFSISSECEEPAWKLEQRFTIDSDNELNLFGSSVSLSGNTALVSVGSTNHAIVYVRSGDSWTEQQVLSTSNGSQSLSHVALDNDTAVIAGNWNPSVSETVYVFVRDGTTWSEQQALELTDGTDQVYSALSVSLSGDTIVAQTLDDFPTSLVFVFTRAGTTWQQQQQISIGTSFYTHPVSIDGDTFVVGAAAGTHVFVRSGESWNQQDFLVPSDDQGGMFGHAVAISGDTLVVEDIFYNVAPNNNHGVVYVFERSGTTWSEQAKLLPVNGEDLDFFGYSVSVEGDRIAVGAMGDDDGGRDSGAVYVFERTDETWVLDKKLLSGDVGEHENFGYSVSLSGDTLLAGAPDSFNQGEDGLGAAYVFVKDTDCGCHSAGGDGASFGLFSFLLMLF